MTTLITGGTGLVGSLATRGLLERGEKVVLFDVAPQTSFLTALPDGVIVVRGDVLDFPDLLRAIQKEEVDRIIHAAGILGPGAAARPYTTVKVNALGTANVYEAARMAGVRRVVFCSSTTVYDVEAPSDEPITEEFPVGPRTVYASTKVFGENMGRNYLEMYGLDVVIVRFAPVYGPARTFGGAANVLLQALIDRPALGQTASLRRPGMDSNEYLHAKDAANSTLLACFVESPIHRVFNISTGSLTTFDELTDLVRDLIPGALISILDPDPAGYHSLYLRKNPQPCSIKRAQRELGYVPEYDLRRGLTEYIGWVRQMSRAVG